MAEGGCLHAWPAGLSDFMWYEIGGLKFVECWRPANHRGKHGDAERTMMWWGGQLSEDEEERARMMRSLGLTEASSVTVRAGILAQLKATEAGL